MLRGFILVLLSFSLLPKSAITQIQQNRAKFEHLAGSEKLPGPIWCILTDQRGYLWVGTPVGLYINDGKSFHQFNHPNPDFKANDGFFQILEARNGDIWFTVNDSKLYRYQPEIHHLEVFQDTGDSFSATKSTGWRLYEDRKGRIWASSRNWFSYYSYGENRFYGFQWSKENPSSLVTSFYEKSDGKIWIGGQGKLALFNPETHLIEKTWSGNDLPFKGIRCVIEAPDGNLWIGTTEGICLKTPGVSSIRSFPEEHPASYFNQDTVTFSFQSSLGEIYFGSFSKGVAKLKLADNSWDFYPVFQSGLDAPNSRCIDEYDGELYFGALDGIYVLPLHSPLVAHIMPSSDMHLPRQADFLTWLLPTETGLVAGSYISGVFQFQDTIATVLHSTLNGISAIPSKTPEHFWVAGTDGLTHLHYLTGNSTPVTQVLNHWLFSLQFWKDDLILGSIGAGVMLYNYKNDSVKEQWLASSNLTKGLSNNFCHTILVNQSEVWMGTGVSVTRFDDNTGLFQSYFQATRAGKNSHIQTIFIINKDSNGTVWAGCSWGLIYYDAPSDSFVELPLPEEDQIVYALQNDLDNHLWVATSKNIFRINPINREIQQISEGKKYASFFHRFTRSCIDKNGYLYFSAENGYLRIDPKLLKQNKSVKPYHISSFHAKGASSVYTNNNFAVLPNYTSLDIPWSAEGFKLQLSAPQSHTHDLYQIDYQLIGFNQNMKHKKGLNSIIEYTNVPPGRYRFTAKAKGHEVIVLNIRILPAWWQSYLFQGGMLLLAILLLWQLYRWRTKSLRNRGKKLETIVLEKTEDLKLALSKLSAEVEERKRNEIELEENLHIQEHLVQEVNHRVKNNLSSILSLVHEGDDYLDDGGSARSFIETLASRVHALSTVHNMLSLSKWQPVLLHELARDIIELTIQNYRGQPCRLNINPSPCMVSSSQAQHLGLILTELTSNSLKHCKTDSELEISLAVSCAEKTIRLNYHDDGPGYPEHILDNPLSRNAGGVFLISMLVSHSLQGKVSFSNMEGATCSIEFLSNTSEGLKV